VIRSSVKSDEIFSGYEFAKGQKVVVMDDDASGGGSAGASPSRQSLSLTNALRRVMRV
jgi:hypothetical protein